MRHPSGGILNSNPPGKRTQRNLATSETEFGTFDKSTICRPMFASQQRKENKMERAGILPAELADWKSALRFLQSYFYAFPLNLPMQHP
jgi:hypothetical protein